MEQLKLGKYEHYKGEEVEVIGIAKHSETLEDLVVYKTLRANKGFPAGTIWARPKVMFIEKVEVNDRKIPRFKYLD